MEKQSELSKSRIYIYQNRNKQVKNLHLSEKELSKSRIYIYQYQNWASQQFTSIRIWVEQVKNLFLYLIIYISKQMLWQTMPVVSYINCIPPLQPCPLQAIYMWHHDTLTPDNPPLHHYQWHPEYQQQVSTVSSTQK